MSRRFLWFRFAAVAFSVFAFSCASGKELPRDQFFYEENVSFFKESALDNGIPVIIKDIPMEKNIDLRLVFAGGASSCPKGKSGLDQLTFDLISQGNPKIKQLLARGLYFDISSCKADYSSLGFSCAAEDFDECLEVFADSFLKPEYSHDDYIKLEGAAASGAMARSENPRFELLEAVKEKIYAVSPYLDGEFYKPSSRVSEYDIEKNLAGLANASRITIVAAGNFSFRTKEQKSVRRDKKTDMQLFEERAQKLLQRLQDLYGGLEAKTWTAPGVPAVKAEAGASERVHSEFAGGDFYAAQCRPCPNRGADDYEAFAISTIALDAVLSRELVEKQKAALYCGTAVLNAKESAALIIAAGKGDGKNFSEALAAAFSAFPQEYEMSRALEMYKNIYIGRVLGSSQNAAATVEQIMSSLCYEGDAKAYLLRPQKIRAVTVQDVTAAFEKYFLAEDSLYVLLTN